MVGRRRFQVPEGWVARGWRFEVEATTSQQRSAIAQHFGARRFAYNWALAQVKANLEARAADPAIVPLAWNFYELRRAWSQAKHQVAPWWRHCSKEAYACGIADLVTALHNWSASKHGHRAGARVGFPRFKARRRDRGRVRFTTGAMRLEADRRHIIVPVIGRLRAKENTRRLERLVARGRARVLSMTLSQQGGRLFVSVATIVARAPRMPSQPDGRCGIDLGSVPSGRSSPTATIRSNVSPIPRHGSPCSASAAAWPGSCRAASSAPEATVTRTPSWRPLTGGRPISGPSRCTPSPPGWRAATAPW
jgi:putative transposase